EDYRAYANIFGTVNVAVSPESQKAFRAAQPERQKKSQQRINELRRMGMRVTILPVGQLRELYLGRPNGLLPHPETGRSLTPRALGGPEINVPSSDDARKA